MSRRVYVAALVDGGVDITIVATPEVSVGADDNLALSMSVAVAAVASTISSCLSHLKLVASTSLPPMHVTQIVA